MLLPNFENFHDSSKVLFRNLHTNLVHTISDDPDSSTTHIDAILFFPNPVITKWESRAYFCTSRTSKRRRSNRNGGASFAFVKSRKKAQLNCFHYSSCNPLRHFSVASRVAKKPQVRYREGDVVVEYLPVRNMFTLLRFYII